MRRGADGVRPDQGPIVVALGGNAILQPAQVGTFEEQLLNIDESAGHISRLAAAGNEVIVVHGNGPQVGNILIQQEATAAGVAPMPMDVCGAMSQGQLGYLLAQCLENRIRRLQREIPVCCVVTETVVDAADPAFERPSKPVGPFYSEEKARSLALEQGFTIREDAGRGWRRVVPSPDPKRIVQLPAIRKLVEAGVLVVCVGGGGIPVLEHGDRSLSGTAAVIDKDLAAARLALDVGASTLLILTDVPRVCLHHGSRDEVALEVVTVEDAEVYASAGHFKAGSMGPKVEACLRMARAGRLGMVAGPGQATGAMNGEAGTQFIPCPEAAVARRVPGRCAAPGVTAPRLPQHA